jgi:hypothetical protein
MAADMPHITLAMALLRLFVPGGKDLGGMAGAWP